MNSVISTRGAQYMTLYTKNFYLNTPILRYKYVRIKIEDILEEIIVEYKLRGKVPSDSHVYVRGGDHKITKNIFLPFLLFFTWDP
jgi:hypothetical protein